MAERLHLTRYTQRWQIETVNSMLKRLQGSALRARKAWSQYRELTLRAITHNILILWILRVFYRAEPDWFQDLRRAERLARLGDVAHSQLSMDLFGTIFRD